MTTVELRPVPRLAEVADLVREQPNVRLLAVRSPGEYETVRISGSCNVPLDTLGEHAGAVRANVAGTTVLVCQSGQRALRIAAGALAASVACSVPS